MQIEFFTRRTHAALHPPTFIISTFSFQLSPHLPRPIRTIKQTKNETMDYEFHLTISTLEEIRARFAKLPKKPNS